MNLRPVTTRDLIKWCAFWAILTGCIWAFTLVVVYGRADGFNEIDTLTAQASLAATFAEFTIQLAGINFGQTLLTLIVILYYAQQQKKMRIQSDKSDTKAQG